MAVFLVCEGETTGLDNRVLDRLVIQFHNLSVQIAPSGGSGGLGHDDRGVVGRDGVGSLEVRGEVLRRRRWERYRDVPRRAGRRERASQDGVAGAQRDLAARRGRPMTTGDVNADAPLRAIGRDEAAVDGIGAELGERHPDGDVPAGSDGRRIGVAVRELDDGLVIEPSRVRPGVVETYDDHRIAMSFALIGLRVGGIGIRDPECVRKTFPDFFAHLEELRQ